MTKKELIDKLKELGVYEQWKKNVRIDALDAQIPFYSRCYHLLNEGLEWNDFLVYSFPWKFTDEGHEFWNEISKK